MRCTWRWTASKASSRCCILRSKTAPKPWCRVWPTTCPACVWARACRPWAKGMSANSAKRAACAGATTGRSRTPHDLLCVPMLAAGSTPGRSQAGRGVVMTPAYQADAQAVSREVFYAIACDPQRSVAVEAWAGAGKTWMLVSRIVRGLLDGAQPHEILAITFTRKAAGEMRERLGDWLRHFAAPTLSDAERAQELVLRGMPTNRAAELAPALAGLHERVLDSGRAVEIRTFHAWLSQLLHAAP